MSHVTSSSKTKSTVEKAKRVSSRAQVSPSSFAFFGPQQSQNERYMKCISSWTCSHIPCSHTHTFYFHTVVPIISLISLLDGPFNPAPFVSCHHRMWYLFFYFCSIFLSLEKFNRTSWSFLMHSSRSRTKIRARQASDNFSLSLLLIWCKCLILASLRGKWDHLSFSLPLSISLFLLLHSSFFHSRMYLIANPSFTQMDGWCFFPASLFTGRVQWESSFSSVRSSLLRQSYIHPSRDRISVSCRERERRVHNLNVSRVDVDWNVSTCSVRWCVYFCVWVSEFDSVMRSPQLDSSPVAHREEASVQVATVDAVREWPVSSQRWPKRRRA